MVVERVRIYQGSTEIQYVELFYKRNSRVIVDEATFFANPNSSLTLGSTLEFRKKDGTTKVFSGIIRNIEKDTTWKISVLTNGYELVSKFVEKVYSNISPEDIVKDVVDNFTTNLTYASTETSGITIGSDTPVVFQDYAINIIRRMSDILRWRLTIDEDDNVYFTSKGSTNSGVTLTNGSNFVVDKWIEDIRNPYFVNKVKVIGGFASFQTQDTDTGNSSQTVFTLTSKPNGVVRITDGGTEIDPTTYTVSAEEKKITFNSAPTGALVFSYEVIRPIVVNDQNDASISSYGEVFQEIRAPFLNTRSDVRRYAKEILLENSDPFDSVRGYLPTLNFDLNPNEIVSTVDNLRSLSQNLVIEEIEYEADTGRTYVVLGESDYIILDWQETVTQRIRDLENQFTTDSTPTFARTIRNNLQINLTTTVTATQKTPVDSFIANDTTLGMGRVSINTEADCSHNGNHGTWNGAGINGSQYDTAPIFRLSCGVFTASNNNSVTSSGVSESGIRTCIFFYDETSLPGGIVTLTGGKTISLDASGNITTAGLTGVSSSKVTLTNCVMAVVNFDAVTVTNPTVGYDGSDYYDGKLDEFMLFNKVLDAGEQTTIQNKTFYKNSSFFINCKLWWSFDNPKLGTRITTI